MTSAYSTNLRIEKQGTGDNINTWGTRLNTAIDRFDFSIAGLSTVALTSSRALTSSNTADDEARSGMLKFTGAGGFTATVPAVSKIYEVWNASSGIVTIACSGGGDSLEVDSGDILHVFCDGTNVKTLGFGSQSIKDYIAAVAWASSAALPAQTGNSGKFVKTDGTNASWQYVNTTDIADWSTKRTELVNLAAAFAVAL